MPAFSRAVFLALQAAALVSLVGHPLSLAPSFALAAPVPMPMPLMPHLADYAAQPPARSSAASVPSSESVSTVRRQDVAVVSHTTSTSSPAVAHEARGDTDTNILNNINLLGTMYSQMNDHSRVLNDLASRASTEGNSEEFRQDSVSQVTAYKTSLTSFTSILAALGADKGLANYDRSNELETMLKDIVNANKDAMSALYELVNGLPTLGPLLGPLVYEIKCIVDDLLNAVENLTDALLNALQPLLLGLVDVATKAVCGAGLDLGALCVI